LGCGIKEESFSNKILKHFKGWKNLRKSPREKGEYPILSVVLGRSRLKKGFYVLFPRKALGWAKDAGNRKRNLKDEKERINKVPGRGKKEGVPFLLPADAKGRGKSYLRRTGEKGGVEGRKSGKNCENGKRFTQVHLTTGRKGGGWREPPWFQKKGKGG